MEMVFAYIDPFTGSLLLQLLVMGFMSVMVFFKKVRAFFSGLFGGGKSVVAEGEPEVQSIKIDERRQEEKKVA